MRRSHVYRLRSMIHRLEGDLKGRPRSQKDESERDLIATACSSLWELDVKRLISCLRRLTLFRPEWQTALDYARLALNS